MNSDLKEIILIFLKGLFMGSADIVPGVSGGTIALITGIYERLIYAISRIRFSFLKPLLKANFSEFKEKLIDEIDFELFVPLILGIGIAFITLAKVISYLLDTQTAYTFSFFLGLILASAYILYTRLENFNIKLIHFRTYSNMCNDLARNLWVLFIIATWTVPIHAKCFKFKKSSRNFCFWYRCSNRYFRIFQTLELFAWKVWISYNGIFNRNYGWNIKVTCYENNIYNSRFLDSMHYFSFNCICTYYRFREKI